MKLLPSCQQVQSELTEYAEGALPVPRSIGIWVHLLLCRVCAGFLRGLGAMPGLAKRALAPPDEPPEDAARALAEVQAALKRETP